MKKFDDDIDDALVLLMELLYTALGKERIPWYEPDSIKWKDSLAAEVLRINSLWMKVGFQGFDDAVRQPYIQRQQIVLIHCLDWIEVIVGEDHERVEVSQFAKNKVEHLLQMLFVHFRKDLKMDLPFPITQQVILIYLLKQGLPALQQKLQKSRLQKEFMASIVACFIHFIKAASVTRYTYGQVLMMQELMEWLSETRQLKTLSVFLRLCYFNCNYMGFYRIATKWFDSKKITIESAVKFRRLVKFFRRMPMCGGYFWRKDRLPLVQLLADYLEDITCVAESNIKLQIEPVPTAHTNGRAGDRLQFRLTVEQLGLVIKVMKEAHILGPLPLSHIIRFCVDHVTTEGKQQDQRISYEYLKASINKSRVEVYDLVEQRLNDMLVSLRKLRITFRNRKENRD